MSNPMLPSVVLLLLNLYINLASSHSNDAHIVLRFAANEAIGRKYQDFQDARSPSAAMRILARNPDPGRNGRSSGHSSSLDSTGNQLAGRDNKINDLFFDQLQQQQSTRQPLSEQTTASLGESKVYNTINLDNSIEEPEMFTNNHQSSSTFHLSEPPLTNTLTPGASSGHLTTTGGYNSRHYNRGYGQLSLGNQQHNHQYHSQHHNHHHQNQHYGKYSPNMFANNFNLNYIHSFLTNKPPSSQPTSLLNMPNLLNSNPNGLTLSTYGSPSAGYATAYISASSALSAAANNLQLGIAQKQQQLGSTSPHQMSSERDLMADSSMSESPSTHVVNASIGDLPGSSMCGRQQVAYREPRVVGGNSTYEGEFPWAVSIQRHGNHHCGGVIVGRRWILTAAHCVRSQLVGNLIVRTGGHTLTRSANSLNSHLEKDYQVEQIVMHDDFSRYDNLTISQLKSSANTNNADIALLKLKYEIHWNDLAWPVCFPNREAGNFSGHDATVIGWGKLNEKSEEFSNELQKVKLTIIDNKVCQNWFRQAGRDMPIDDRIICAGFKSGGKDACHGDSGGPLLSRINGQYVVVGVVSTGIGCARPLLPGLYSRVSSYINWIERYITN